MSYFIAVPDELALAATELDSIGAALSVANVAAALPTTGILAAGGTGDAGGAVFGSDGVAGLP